MFFRKHTSLACCARSTLLTSLASVVVLTAVAAAPSTAHAKDGVHEHDGFLFRALIGPTYAWTEDDSVLFPATISGGGITASFSIGGSLNRSVALHLDSVAISLPQPTVEVEGVASGTSSATLTHQGLGPALSYYFDSNNYLAFGLLAAMATVEADGRETSTDLGYGLTLTGGNEWWVSDNWGIGVAAQLFYSDVPDGDTNLTTTAFSVMFTATWN